METENKKQKIMIVDDDSFLLDMYAIKFGQHGFEVHPALGPVEALEILRSGFIPDIILTDIVMPVMDGFEMLDKMNEEGLGQTSVRVVLSNRGMSSDISDGKKRGASGYIVKASNTPEEVVQKVKDIVLNKK